MGAGQPADGTNVPDNAQTPQAYVCVLGTRLDRFVEFEFSLGDGDLSVDLILPIVAFDEFCKARGAILLPLKDSISADLDRIAWRAGQPGLLRRLSSDAAGAI
jgi:phenol hydroxylase P0 protein